MLPASYKDVEAAYALIDYARAQRHPRLLGHMVTTWSKKDDLRSHPALVESLARLGASP